MKDLNKAWEEYSEHKGPLADERIAFNHGYNVGIKRGQELIREQVIKVLRDRMMPGVAEKTFEKIFKEEDTINWLTRSIAAKPLNNKDNI
jgi:hypothetical protein